MPCSEVSKNTGITASFHRGLFRNGQRRADAIETGKDAKAATAIAPTSHKSGMRPTTGMERA